MSGEQTHAGMGVFLAPAVQDTSCPRDIRRGQSTQTKDSDLTKWAVNDSSVKSYENTQMWVGGCVCGGGGGDEGKVGKCVWIKNTKNNDNNGEFKLII